MAQLPNATIIFPKGGGGSWLANLMWHLENCNWSLVNTNTIFDTEPKGSIACWHSDYFAWAQNGNKKLVFSSSNAQFNHYINEIKKILYGIHNMHFADNINQVQFFSEKITHYTTNLEYYNNYYNQVDLDYRLVFQDPDAFAQQLFDTLDQYQVNYTKNHDYVLKSIKHYQSTCVNPADHIGNLDSLMWLGFCHSQLSIDWVSSNLEEIRQQLVPLNQQCIDKVKQFSFLWTS